MFECVRLASITNEGDIWGIGACTEYDDSDACNATYVRYKKLFNSLGWK